MRLIPLVLLLVLAACASTESALQADQDVRLFLSMAGGANYSEMRVAGDDVASLADLARAECPGGIGTASIRSMYKAPSGTLVIYSHDGNVTCSVLKPAGSPAIEYLPRASAPEGVAMTVNGRPVTLDRVQAGLDALPEGTPRDEQALGLVLDRLINDELLLQASEQVTLAPGEIVQAREDFLAQHGLTEAQLRPLEDAQFNASLQAQARIAKLLRQRLLLDEINISAEEARAYYLSNPNQFLRTEQAVMRHIFISAENRTPEALQARVQQVSGLLATEDFCELVARYSDDPQKDRCGVYVVPRGMIDPSLELASFTTPANQTAVVQAGAGVHFVQTLQVVPAQVVPYGEIERQLQDLMADSVLQQRLSMYLTLLRSDAQVKVYLG